MTEPSNQCLTSDRRDDMEEEGRPAKRPKHDTSSSSEPKEGDSRELPLISDTSSTSNREPVVSDVAARKVEESPESNALRLAIGGLKLDEAKSLIEQGVSVNTADPVNGETPLFTICRLKPSAAQASIHIDLINSLIAHGALVNFKNHNEQTPLHVASTCQAVRILVQNGASVNEASRYGTPLYLACKYRRSDNLILALLAAGANVENGYKSATPLHVAGLSAAKLLAGHGANVNAVTEYYGFHGESPLFKHCRNSSYPFDVINVLLENGASINFKSRNGRTPLHAASLCDLTKTVEFLLLKGASVDEVDNEGETPLFMAAKKLSVTDDTIKMLLTHGACVNHTNNAGRTPLHVCRNSATILLQNGALVNAVDLQTESPLFMACHGKRWYDDNVPILLQNGASVNLENYLGNTALHVACSSGIVHMASLLLRSGAVVNHLNTKGETPLFAAVENGVQEDLINLLLENGADIDWSNYKGRTPLHVACLKESTSKNAMTLIQKGAKVDTFDVEQESPFFVACRIIKNHSLAIELLDRGAHPNVQNTTGMTVFHLLLSPGYSYWQPKFFKALVEKGVRVNGVDNNGDTPLSLACSKNYYRRDGESFVRFLLDNGATVNHENAQGLTPLQKALDCGAPLEQIRPVLQHGALINDVRISSFREVLTRRKKDGDALLSLLFDYGAFSRYYIGQEFQLPDLYYNVMRRHLTKLKAIEDSQDGSHHYGEYHSELGKMMQERVGGTGVTLYDLLTLKVPRADYDTVVSVVTDKLLKAVCPSFADMTL